jgi:TatD DNase family protein
MEFIDTHCHLHFDNYDTDRDQVLEKSAKLGVRRVICVGCSLEDSERAIDFANLHSNVWATAGAHPHDGADYLTKPDSGAKLKELLKRPKVVAVGEIGLDYFHENTPKADQQKVLKAQIEIGLATGLPFVFHVRDAWDDFWPIFDSYEGLRGVVHSFSTNPAQLAEVLKRGLYVGLNGIMTFTKDDQQLEAAKQVPLDKLLLETDAPFLAPKAYRGSRCEPGHVVDVAKFLAELRGEPIEQIAKSTTTNALKIFNLETK